MHAGFECTAARNVHVYRPFRHTQRGKVTETTVHRVSTIQGNVECAIKVPHFSRDNYILRMILRNSHNYAIVQGTREF